jgi:hypothetical protein
LTKKSFEEKFVQLFGETFSNCFRECRKRGERKIDVWRRRKIDIFYFVQFKSRKDRM